MGCISCNTRTDDYNYRDNKEQSSPINQQDKEQRTIYSNNDLENALFEAAIVGNTEQINNILNKDIKPDASGNTTPLMQAAYHGQIEAAKVLIKHGADVNANRPSGTPLIYAAQAGQDEMIKFLIENGAKVNMTGGVEDWTPIRVAAEKGHVGTVKLLLDAKADISIGDNKFHNTVIGFAAFLGHTEVVKLLIEEGADVNARGAKGQTPLMDAAWGGNVDAIKLLLKAGAIVNLKDSEGKTALKWAIDFGRKNVPEVTRILRDAGATGD